METEPINSNFNYMDKNALFVKYHWNQLLILVVVMFSALTFQAVLVDTNWFWGQDKGEVLGEATAVPNNQAGNMAVIQYQSQLKGIMDNYFQKRTTFIAPHQDWLFLINNAKYQTLGLAVPEEYQNLHEKIITNFDLEYQAVEQNNNQLLEGVNNHWAEILNQYFWLNK
jgi:hypothetical protein